MEWKPIETAPTDGTWVLLAGGEIVYGWCGDNQPSQVVGQYSTHRNGREVEGHWQFAWYDGGYYGTYERPTHWAHLWPPPVAQQPR